MKRPEKIIGQLKSHPVIKRHPANPILRPEDVARYYPSSLVFNCGVCKYQGRYVMVFRNDYGSRDDPRRLVGTNLGLAFSDDGIHWEVAPTPCFDMRSEEIIRAYDSRLVVLEGKVYMCFAIDTRHGTCGAIATTEDFERWEVIHTTVPDNRNMVLFPEKVNGRYVRLERPFPMYSRGGERFDIWLSASPDLRYWGDSHLVLAVEHVPFANTKIGPGTPPVRTPYGWLIVFHAVDFDPSRGKNGWEPKWQKRYTAGLALLDLEEPWKVKSLLTEPLIAPEAPYEVSGGYRNNVIFPTGIVVEDDGEVKIYYGAADTVVALATARLDDLLALLV